MIGEVQSHLAVLSPASWFFLGWAACAAVRMFGSMLSK